MKNFDVRITPSVAHGTVQAPPSKSMAHRMLICAGLAGGDARVDGVADSQDVLATKDCLESLDALRRLAEGDAVAGGPVEFPCRESGSTLRFFIPLALLRGTPAVFKGTEKLMSRGLSVYEDLCAQRGLRFEPSCETLMVQGPLRAGDFQIPGNLSSQFVSGLLFALPQLRGDSTIRLVPPVESRPYIDMTIQALSTFGVHVAWLDDLTLRVPGGQRFQPRHVQVEGDCSNAAFFEALNYAGGSVQVTGMRQDTLQGDAVYADYFERLAKGGCENGGPTLDISNCPDLGPILFVVAALCHGATFTGTARLRMKESDRGAAMREELAKFGVDMKVEGDAITVPASTIHAPTAPLSGHNDHRVVMALSVLACRTGAIIRGAQAVGKSFPDFFQQLQQLEVKVELHALD